MRKRTNEDLLLSQEFQIAAFRALHGLTPEIAHEDITPFAGTYEFYKPAHDNPDRRINVGRLIIGEKARVEGVRSAFSCSYESRRDGNRNGLHAHGVFIPLYDTANILLQTRSGGRIQIALDHLDPSGSDNRYDDLGGVFVSHLSKWQPMTSPVHARRIDPSEFRYRSIPATRFEELPRAVRKRLARGNIYWADETFPGFGMSKFGSPT